MRSRSTRCRRRTATAAGSRATSPRGCRSARPSSPIRRSRSADAATRRWDPSIALAVEGRLLLPDARVRRHASVEDRLRLSATSRSRATTPARRSAAGRSRGTRRTTPTTRPPIRRSTRTRCRPTPTFRPRPSRGYIQDDWQVGERSDVESRPALRPSARRVQRGRARPAGEHSGQARTRRHVPARRRRREAADGEPRRLRTTSGRASASRGIPGTTA